MPNKKELGDATMQVTAYPREQHVDLWKEVKPSDKSLSSFIIDIVNEAAAREKTNTKNNQTGDKKQLEKLREENKKLRKKIVQLENDGEESTTLNLFQDEEYIKNFLSQSTPKTLPQLIQEIIESGTLDQHVRQPVENTLYELASENKVEYSRNGASGWQLSQQEGEQK